MHEFDSTNIEVTTTEWTYDAADRLTHEERTLGLVPLDIAYQYDQNGNRTREIRGQNIVRYSYNENDQLTKIEFPDYITEEYAYDARGNLDTVTQKQGITTLGTTNYTFDARNQLTAVTSGIDTLGTFSYDYAGRRIQMNDGTLTTDYLWNEFSAYGDVVLETNVAGTTAYTLASGTLISQTVDTGTPVTSYFLTDAIGSTRMLTDGAGQIAGSFEYDAFGNLLGDPDVQSLGTDYLFAGQQFDPMTELYSMRARYYDASVGRFMSRDTYPYNYGNPVELNRYTYARNNPVMFTDPSGNTSLMEYVGTLVDNAGQGAVRGMYRGGLAGFAGSAISVIVASTGACGNYIQNQIQAKFGPNGTLLDYISYMTYVGAMMGAAAGAAGGFAGTFGPMFGQLAQGTIDAYGVSQAAAQFSLNPNLCSAIELGMELYEAKVSADDAAAMFSRRSSSSDASWRSYWDNVIWGGEYDLEYQRYLLDEEFYRLYGENDFGFGCNSFSAETEVSTAEGDVPIAEVEIGDLVLAYNEETRTVGEYEVTNTIHHVDEVIIHLTIDGELVETTPEHPFYTDDGEWVNAEDLEVGELIYSLDGDYGTVEAVVVIEDANQSMYNLTVDEAHTFFVGDGDWLVHNKGGRCEWQGVGGFTRDILNKGFHFNYYTSNKKYEIGVIPDDTTNTVYVRWLDDNSTNFNRRELQTISEFLNSNKTKGAELAESLRRIAETQAQNNPGQATAYTNVANQASRLNGIFSSGEQITVLGGS